MTRRLNDGDCVTKGTETMKKEDQWMIHLLGHIPTLVEVIRRGNLRYVNGFRIDSWKLFDTRAEAYDFLIKSCKEQLKELIRMKAIK